jgi:hypothetical protein
VPLIIPEQTLPDPPGWAEWQTRQPLVTGGFEIAGNRATVQQLYGSLDGEVIEGPAVSLDAGHYEAAPGDKGGYYLLGFRAQSAQAGVGASFAASLWTANEPHWSYINPSTIMQAGRVLIPVVLLANWPPSGSLSDSQSCWLELPAAYDPVAARPTRLLCVWNAADGCWDVTGPALMAAWDGTAGGIVGGYAPNGGPSLTIPVKGDYRLSIAPGINFSGTADCLASYAVGAVAPVDVDAYRASGTNGQNYQGASRRTLKTAIAAGTVIQAEVRAATGGGYCTWGPVRLAAEPVRFYS